MNSKSDQRLIVLFDGVCALCNASVSFIRKHDKNRRFSFVPQQSDEGKALLCQFERNEKSLVFIENDRAWTESTAALRIAKYLDGAWKMASVLLLIPPYFRDSIYRFIARNRRR